MIEIREKQVLPEVAKYLVYILVYIRKEKSYCSLKRRSLIDYNYFCT